MAGARRRTCDGVPLGVDDALREAVLGDRRGGLGGMDWRERITVDPAICHGSVCIRGTRIQVAAVLDDLAAGLAVEDILGEYPPLTPDDVLAALAYAADLARERQSPLRDSA